MLKSSLTKLGLCTFPAFMGAQVYMREFFQDKGLPDDLKDWQKTVDQMLAGIKTNKPLYLMVDQSFVKAGAPHRRPGVHIDGYWIPAIGAHGGGHGGNAPGGHGSRRGHNAYPPGHKPGRSRHLTSWEESDYLEPEALILASNYTACKAYTGEFDGKIKEGGDASEINMSNLTEHICEANRVYAGNVTMLHESLPVKEDVYRTLVRINAPGVDLH